MKGDNKSTRWLLIILIPLRQGSFLEFGVVVVVTFYFDFDFDARLRMFDKLIKVRSLPSLEKLGTTRKPSLVSFDIREVMQSPLDNDTE